MAHHPYWRGYFIDVDPNDPDSPDGLVRNLHDLTINLEANQIIGQGKHH